MADKTVASAPGASTAALLERSAALAAEAKRLLRELSGSNGANRRPEELLDKAVQLKDAGWFDFACRILVFARQHRTSDDALRYRLAQQLALCTYKNEDAPLIDRL